MFIKDGIAYANVPSDEIKIITALMVYIINGLVVKNLQSINDLLALTLRVVEI